MNESINISDVSFDSNVGNTPVQTQINMEISDLVNNVEIFLMFITIVLTLILFLIAWKYIMVYKEMEELEERIEKIEEKEKRR